MFNSSRFFRSVEINPTELCNFKCVFCPRATFYPNQNLHMSRDTIDLLITQLPEMPNLHGIFVAGRGEPTLHNEFEYLANSLVEYKQKHQSDLYLHLATNGKRLDRYRQAVDGFDDIKLSLYDETPLGFEKPFIDWHNVKIKNRRLDYIIPRGYTDTYHNRAGAINTEITRVDNTWHEHYGLLCDKPFDVVYVDWNGDYNLCCDDWEDIQVLGNIHTESLGQYITTNKKLKSYQQDLLQSKRDKNPCASCNKRVADLWLDYMHNPQYYE